MTKEFYEWIYNTSPERWSGNVGQHGIDSNLKQYIKEYKDKKIKIIDLGCGIGTTLTSLQEYNWELYGVDYVPKAIEIAKNRLRDKAIVKVKDLNDTGFPDKFFDIVYSLGVFEHLDKPNFNEPRRIIKDDGLFMCQVPTENDESKTGKVETTFCINHSKGKRGTQFEMYHTEEHWKRLMEESNFQVFIPRKNIFLCKPI